MIRLTIWTQNCSWWSPFSKSRRFSLISEAINRSQPDIIFLQEAIFISDIKYFHLPDYYFFTCPQIIFNGGGLVTIVHRRHQTGSPVFIPFADPGSWYNPPLTDRLLGKGYLKVKLKDLNLSLVNTHLASDFLHPRRSLEYHQQHQFHQLLAENQTPTIFGGDLNFPPASKVYRSSLSSFHDHTSKISISYPKGRHRLDYIFTTQVKIKLSRSSIISYPHPPSDHLGLCAVIHF